MRRLDWSRFQRLQGSPSENWELLCRELIRRHYERFGPLLTRKQQPGVEFHLTIEREGCALGEPGRRWGWQCRWLEEGLRKDGRLRAAQRRSIEEAIAKSAEHVTGLTDWVLWTRHKLATADARWFEALEAPFTLRCWDEETLAGLLSGPAEVLRETWFGELTLDRATLTERRREALAPIQHRYIEELHLRTLTELGAEDLLLGHHLEAHLLRLARVVEMGREAIDSSMEDPITEGSHDFRERVLAALEGSTAGLWGLRERVQGGDTPTAEEIEAVADLAALEEPELEGWEAPPDPDGPPIDAEQALREVRRSLGRAAAGLRTTMMVVLGRAGSGKTHLAASLTGPDDDAHGVLVLGQQFGAAVGDDDLARHSGLGATRDELLEALDALGMREGRRVPLVIDGINESDDPRAWRVALARLRTRLEKLSHVFAVVTVRPSYRRFAIPPDLPTVELPGLSGREDEAVKRYFDYYRIEADPTAVHWWRPADPLLLSIFCRTVNPLRREPVRTSELPASLTEVFEAYLDQVCDRVATTMSLPPEDVTAAVLRLGERCFWSSQRDFARDLVAEALGDRERERWSESMRFQLEAEEVLIRDMVGDEERVAWSYDLLAGHVLAKGLLERTGAAGLAAEEVVSALQSHPLHEDMLAGLVGVLGARGQDLAAILDSHPELATKAALAALRLPASQVGDATVARIRRLFDERPQVALEALSEVLLRHRHPLNARLLDTLLGGLDVWRRDLTWTSWMQANPETLLRVGRLSGEWRLDRDSADDEAAIVWLSWVLTSTDRPLRDAAIQALCRVGRRRPEPLFARTLEMLGANDPTIPDGLLAASYGVAMASQTGPAETLQRVLELAAELRDRLLDPQASQPSFHWRIREYAYRINQFAAWISDGDFRAPTAAAQPPLPQPDGEVPRFAVGSGGWLATDRVPGLSRAAAAIRALPVASGSADAVDRRLAGIEGEIRARVAELGWSEDRFGDSARDHREEAVEDEAEAGLVGFGGKYASIAFLEAIGRLSDQLELRTRPAWRLPDPPLDPSFPASAPMVRKLPHRIDPSGGKLGWRAWTLSGHGGALAKLAYGPILSDGRPGAAIDATLWRGQHDGAEPILCTVRGLLALDGWATVRQLSAERYDTPELIPDNPVERSCFAGEAPWAPTFDSEATAADGSFEPRVHSLDGYVGGAPRVELLGVDFAWPTNRSPLNTAEVGSLPSKAFAFHSGLRKDPDRPQFLDASGELAAVSVSPRGIGGWYGTVLYVREDLLQAYCAERGGEWGWLAWVEPVSVRGANPDGPSQPPGGRRFVGMASLEELSAKGPKNGG